MKHGLMGTVRISSLKELKKSLARKAAVVPKPKPLFVPSVEDIEEPEEIVEVVVAEETVEITEDLVLEIKGETLPLILDDEDLKAAEIEVYGGPLEMAIDVIDKPAEKKKKKYKKRKKKN